MLGISDDNKINFNFIGAMYSNLQSFLYGFVVCSCYRLQLCLLRNFDVCTCNLSIVMQFCRLSCVTCRLSCASLSTVVYIFVDCRLQLCRLCLKLCRVQLCRLSSAALSIVVWSFVMYNFVVLRQQSWCL